MQDKVLEQQIKDREQLIVDSGNKIKYNRQGIYGIYVCGKLVYVGKSQDMLHRVASHMLAIDGIGKDAQGKKYQILRQAKEAGLRISFDVLEYVDGTSQDLHTAERNWIVWKMPPLNTQIPKVGKGFTVNKTAKNMTWDMFQKILDKDRSKN